jgi:hypothetical protein
LIAPANRAKPTGAERQRYDNIPATTPGGDVALVVLLFGAFTTTGLLNFGAWVSGLLSLESLLDCW